MIIAVISARHKTSISRGHKASSTRIDTWQPGSQHDRQREETTDWLMTAWQRTREPLAQVTVVAPYAEHSANMGTTRAYSRGHERAHTTPDPRSVRFMLTNRHSNPVRMWS